MKPALINKKNIFDISKTRVKADINGCSVIIPHVCNNIGLFGAGFASAVKIEFPIVATNFELLGKQSKLGYVQYVEALHNNSAHHKLIIANMIAQNRTISANNPRPLNYEYLMICMANIRNYVNTLGDDRVEIHCPKFGSGLAGGDWKLINYLIEDIWKNIPVYVYSK
jgi:hypothetical protein